MRLALSGMPSPIRNTIPAIKPPSAAQDRHAKGAKDEVHFQGKTTDSSNNNNNNNDLSANYNDYIKRLETQRLQEQINRLHDLNRNMITHFKKGTIKASDLQHYISQGADIDAQDGEGNTVSHYAVSKQFLGEPTISNFYKYYQEVKAVLKHKPNVNIPNNKGETPLSIAIRVVRSAYLDWPDAIKLLFDNGALLRRKDKLNIELGSGKVKSLLDEQRNKQIQDPQGNKAYFENVLPSTEPEKVQNSSSQSNVLSNILKHFKKHS